MSDERTSERGGLPEGLRTAVARTLAATASSASQTRERAEALVGEVAPVGGGQLRERAAELLDEVARLGQQASETIARRMDLARGDELAALAERLAALERRLAELEAISITQPRPEG